MEIIWYTAASIDGRIASADNSLAFLDAIGPRPDAHGEFDEFIATIDAVLMGANTLRWLLDGGHGWPHDDLPTWVMTHDATLPERVGATRAPFTCLAGDVDHAITAMKSSGHSRVWLCGGGDLAGQVLERDLLDEIVLTIAPVALGDGPSIIDGKTLPLHRFSLAECTPAGGDAARLVWRRDRSQ